MASKRDATEIKDGEAIDRDYISMRVVDLKNELARRGLPKTGKKADLIARLEADDGGAVASDDGNDVDDGGDGGDSAIILGGPSISDVPTPKTKRKRAKKEPSPDVEIEGPLARDVVRHQDRNPETGEKRLRAFVPEPDDSYKTKLKKIHKERMFMLDRKKGRDKYGYDCEHFDIAGSTGNIYQVAVGRNPSCTCMDALMRGHKCKHINYALIIILKAPTHLCYQTAFFSDELKYIFANAPVTRAPVLEHNHDEPENSSYSGKRKPVDSECPICVFGMEPGEDLVWCKAACGQNFHKECFEQWRLSKNGGRVTCVYCRSEWQEEAAIPGSLASLKEAAPRIGSYKNIGHLPMYQQAEE